MTSSLHCRLGSEANEHGLDDSSCNATQPQQLCSASPVTRQIGSPRASLISLTALQSVPGVFRLTQGHHAAPSPSVLLERLIHPPGPVSTSPETPSHPPSSPISINTKLRPPFKGLFATQLPFRPEHSSSWMPHIRRICPSNKPHVSASHSLSSLRVSFAPEHPLERRHWRQAYPRTLPRALTGIHQR